MIGNRTGPRSPWREAIGANDVGLPADAEGCEVKSATPPPCTNEFFFVNVDRISEVITAQLPVWSALIDRLRVKAPHARIVVVGYGTFVRPGGCFPAQPVLPCDSDYLQSKLNELDDLQQQLAATKGIDYFDTRLLSRDHDICGSPSDRYIEGFLTTGSTVPLHPDAWCCRGGKCASRLPREVRSAGLSDPVR